MPPSARSAPAAAPFPGGIADRSTPGALRRLAFLAAWLTAVSCPAADAVTALAARSLLLDAQTVGGSIVAVGASGHILRSIDSGATWELAAAPTRATLTGVSFPDEQHGWIVGHDAIILHTEDGGRTWSKQYQGDDLQVSFLDVLFLDTQTGFAVGAYAQFLATADGGHTWTPRRIIEDDYFFNRISRGPTGTLYIAGEHGTLLRSTDRGLSWLPIRAPYDGSFYGILPLGPKLLLAYGLRGRIYRSEDDGDTWQLAPDDQRVLLATAVRLRSGPIVAAGQGRAFLVSRDDGRTFTAWSPGLTTGVAELLEAPDGRLLAAGEAGVTPLPAP
ncbi:MAG TPA: YCF48-related protein [Opitutaceae bacterium]|nr:YCF48-related protein [Opitutaceae bacterium]